MTDSRDERDEDRGEAMRRQEAADQPAVRTEDFDGAGQAGQRAAMTKPVKAEAREPGALPVTMVGLRPARLERTPKAVRLTSSHITTPMTTAIDDDRGDTPDEC